MSGVTLDAFAKFQAQVEASLNGIRKAVLDGTAHGWTVSVAGSLVGQNNQTVVCSIPGPPGGYEWHIRRLSFGTELSNPAGVTQQGTLILYKGMVTPGPQGLYTAGSSRDTAFEITRTSVVPDAVTFSTSECIIRAGENIIAAWVSGVGTLIIDGDCEQIPAHGSVALEG